MKLKRRWRRIQFHLLRCLARRLASGGPERLRVHGERAGLWHYRLAVARRRRLSRHLAEALTLPVDQAAVLLREAYRINDRAILEILAMYSGGLNPQQLTELVSLSGLEQLDRALAQGRGVVLLGLHMGNGVAMAAALGLRGYPVSVIYREAGKIPPDFFRDGIRSLGMDAISADPAPAGLRQMLRALKSGRILFILMDQANKRGGEPVRFLGKDQHMPPGPAELARRTGAPIVPALLEGVDAQWHFQLAEPLVLDAGQSLADSVGILIQVMQDHIQKRPQWWTWHQRRWARYDFPRSLA